MKTEPTNWLQAMTDCLSRVGHEQGPGSSALIDCDVVVDPRTAPDGICVWCICRSPEEKHRFTDTELTRFASALRREMLRQGFPETALASLQVQATSRTERDARGGRAGLV